MRVLVTGGAGYIGSVTAATLLDAGHEVVVLDDLSTGHRELVPEGARFVCGSTDAADALGDALGDGVDGCLHFAARVDAGESMRLPETYFADNTAATLRLLREIVAAGVPRFVLSSTAAVYGEPATVPIEEDAATAPTNVYGESKLLIERALAWLAECRGLRTAALRYFNAAGATDDRGECHDPETHLVPIVLSAAAGRRSHVDVFGTDYPTRDGTCVRDFVHVADLADAHVLALGRLDELGTVTCNLGSTTGFTVREVIEAAGRVTGADIPVREAPRRAGDPAELVAATDRAERLLGWRPARQDLDGMVASAWWWHRRRWGEVS